MLHSNNSRLFGACNKFHFGCRNPFLSLSNTVTIRSCNPSVQFKIYALPDILSKNATVRGFAERNAINAPIQGSEADIIKVAMIRIHQRFQREGIRSKMILQVHDELNFSVYPEEKEQVERIVIEEMQQAYPLSVPLTADAGWGNNWLEAH